ncbi:HEAT repeat domain-containing protein [Rugamonas sp. DEMB1]|uniref:HEAT repeat domain-containing protein n=1 Tax=Rugamonas sp. DEMB1 TaxID=3039386 RepID=UPI00244B29BA|nr:hypothetical protein [Rugamonas sp. DEMB1]WGG49389.1 hypothetical protein QC826_22835 [Rugamonas sp. DEMB1]
MVGIQVQKTFLDMNIFRALFGQKKPLALAPSMKPAVEWYVADLIKTISVSESAEELNAEARHYSGYVREAVLKRCVDLAWPELLPVVVERLNDWVPEVRDTARRALETLLPFFPTANLLAVLPAVLKLHSAARCDHAEWLTQFESNFVRVTDVNEIIAAAQGSNIKVARSCVYLLKKYNLLEPTELIELILGRSDDIVLAKQAIELCATLPEDVQGAQYRAAMKSSFGSVRTNALSALLSMESDFRLALVTEALSDAQSSVRSIAMGFLRPLDFNFRAHYRNMLLQQPDVAGSARVCLSALASLRDKDDLELIKTFVVSKRISVRLAALVAWLRLEEQDKDSIALAAISDAAPRIRRFALQAERKHGAYIPFATIQSSLSEKKDMALLLIFAERKKWIWLECIARESMQRGPEDSITMGLDQSLRAWLRSPGRWYQRPTKEQISFLSSPSAQAALRKLLADEPSLERHLEQELGSYVSIL